jgi:hypothetical protein
MQCVLDRTEPECQAEQLQQCDVVYISFSLAVGMRGIKSDIGVVSTIKRSSLTASVAGSSLHPISSPASYMI